MIKLKNLIKEELIVEKKYKLGDQWISGKGAIYSIGRIYQERL